MPETPRDDVSERPEPSANLLADSIFANGLGAHPTGLLSGTDDMDAVEALLPLRQRMSDVMLAAHESVDQQLGPTVATLNLAELQALRTQITLREKQLLVTSENAADLFAPIDPKDHGFATSIIPHAQAPDDAGPNSTDKLSLMEYVQIREENADLAKIVSTRATADLVTDLRRPGVKIEVPGQRRGQTPLTAATSFVAAALRMTFSAVDKRISAAAAMWPHMQYRRTKLATPHLASHLEQGRISLATASTAQQKLSDIRQAVRRAGGDVATADELVAQKEHEFLRHAVRNNPHTFSRYAKSRSEAVTNELIGPAKPLTDDQLKHEKGIFYDGPVGDTLHRITAVVDEGELLHLNAIRELATKFQSAVATMVAEQDGADSSHRLTAEDDRAADDVANHPRITPADVDSGIAQLFDGRTAAERWLSTVMDFLSAGLMLRKTYDPHATAEEHQRRDLALHKAAEHSEVLADLLGMNTTNDDANHSAEIGRPTKSENRTPKGPPDPLEALIPPGYQLLRPNIDVIVEISLQDLTGDRDGMASDHEVSAWEDMSEVARIVERLKDPSFTRGAPVGSPGNIKIDYGLARQQACSGRILPMVLGSASQPLDVGRSQRLFPRAIRRALHVRDRGCIVPGCSVPASWCQAHHLDPWECGGETKLANSGLVCRHHHGAAHKQLLYIHMEPDGLPSVSLPLALDPTGTRYRNVFWQK